MKPIPVIDIFAGPGGLSEGFSAFRKDRAPAFSIRLSIEKDPHAHRTLELRAFVRQFDTPPPEYYRYLKGDTTRDALFNAYSAQAAKAQHEAWHAELGGKETQQPTVDERVSAALGNHGDRWVLIGGPPCQAYSVMGRSRIRGESQKKYEADERHYLYKQYLRIIARHNPPVFVMENVKGLLSAQVKEQRIIENIIRDLSDPAAAVHAEGPVFRECRGYRLYSLVHPKANGSPHRDPQDFIVRSEDYGVPQMRHRLIFLGVRSDLLVVPRTLQSNGDLHTLAEAIGDLPKIRSRLSQEKDSRAGWNAAVASTAQANWIDETNVDQKVRAGIRAAVSALRDDLTAGSEFVAGIPAPAIWRKWYRDPALRGFCNHTARGHMRSDLQRYLFVSIYGKVHGRSPGLEVFPLGLLPKHENVMDALIGSKFNDRFRVQLADRPSTTVTSHLCKDGHYFIHPDPCQCRSLTVREVARLQTFQDNYFFEGPRTEQYTQVGNAVPPLLARRIAGVVAGVLR